MNISARGGDGGTTSIQVDGSVLLSAKGGEGAYEYPGKGGSGGGNMSSSTEGCAGYSDGNGGSSAPGQGKTTRKFGESGNTLYSGGGGAAYGYSSVYSGSGGAGGGGNGRVTTSYGTYYGGNANFYGGGGGGCLIHHRSSSSDASGDRAISGAGYQGLVSLRW